MPGAVSHPVSGRFDAVNMPGVVSHTVSGRFVVGTL